MVINNCLINILPLMTLYRSPIYRPYHIAEK